MSVFKMNKIDVNTGNLRLLVKIVLAIYYSRKSVSIK